MCSSNQARLGPMADLNELACSSPTSVWSRNIRKMVTVPAAAMGASSASVAEAGDMGGHNGSQRADGDQQRPDARRYRWGRRTASAPR